MFYLNIYRNFVRWSTDYFKGIFNAKNNKMKTYSFITTFKATLYIYIWHRLNVLI